MKKILLFIIGLVAVSSMLAQIVYADFESEANTPYFIAFAQTAWEVVDNPAPDAGWDSPKVCMITKGFEVWDGFQLYVGGEFSYGGSDSTWTMMVYSDHEQTIRVGNQNYPTWQDACQVTAVYDTPGQWKKMAFTIPCGTEHYQTLTITTDDGVNGPSVTYIDQIESLINTNLVNERTTRIAIKDPFDTKGPFTVYSQNMDTEFVLLDDGANGDEVAGDGIYSSFYKAKPYQYVDGLDISNLYDSLFYKADGKTFSAIRMENAGTSGVITLQQDFLGLPDGGVASIRRFDNQSITIDGMVGEDEAWNNALVGKHFHTSAPWGAGQALAYWQMYYDLTYCYILVTVQDTFLTSNPENAVYENDNQEIYFNMDNAPAGDPPAYDKNDWQVRYIWNSEEWSGTHAQDAGFDWASLEITRAQNTVSTRAGGVTMYEWQVPWSKMWGNFQPLPGVKFGFDCAYGDDPDGNGRSKIHSWNYDADVAYFNTDSFGEVTLGEAVGITERVELDVQVYPNPTTDRLSINTDDQIQEISLVNTSGQLIKVYSEVHRGLNTFDVSELPSGMYIIKMEVEGGKFDTRTVIIK